MHRTVSGLRAAGGRIVAAAGMLLLVGLLPWLTRTDPARTILHARYADREPTPDALAAIRRQTGLDDGPLHVLGEWYGGLLHGDFGTSWVSGQPVGPQVLSGLGVSLSLMGVSLLVAVVVAALLCVRTLRAGALGRGKALTRARAGAVGAVLAALPEFLLASVLAAVFAVQLGWFPTLGWGGLQPAVLPALAMGLPAGALLGRLLDEALPGAFAEPWVRTNVAFGVPPVRIAGNALRRVLPPLLPQFGFVVVGLTGGAVAVETLFTIPGLGKTALDGAVGQDLPMLQAGVLLLLLLGVFVGAAVGVARRVLIGPALDAAALPALRRPAAGAGVLVRCAALGLTALLVAAVVAGMLRDPLHVDTTARLLGPSGAHPLGTDSLGRDVLARLGHGAARTVVTSVGVGAFALVAGLVLGTGVLGRWTTGLREVVNALPPVVAGLVVAGLLGPGAWGAAVAVAVVAWAPLAAHTAALYEEERGAAHLEGAIALGAGRLHLLTRHVLPGVLPAVLRHALLRVPQVALALASLGFLGLGASPPAPEWGRMLSENMPYAERAPWAVLGPACALAALGMLAVLLGVLRFRGRFRGRGRAKRVEVGGGSGASPAGSGDRSARGAGRAGEPDRTREISLSAPGAGAR